MLGVCFQASAHLCAVAVERAPPLETLGFGSLTMAHAQLRFSLLFTCAAGLVSARAAAHAPVEVRQIISSAPANVILGTNRGLIFGDPTSRSWSLLCNEALGVSTTAPYHVVMLASGRLLLATTDGLRFSDDRGCSWQDLPALPGLSTPALVQHPSDPQRIRRSQNSARERLGCHSNQWSKEWAPVARTRSAGSPCS